MAAKQIFITGVSSFIGTALARRCDEHGITVTGVDVLPCDRSGTYVADIRDPSIADLIPPSVDAIIHLAALSRDPDCRGKMDETLDINVAASLNLARAAEKRAAQRFIFASTEWVYDSFDPTEEKTETNPIDVGKLNSEYAFSKYVAENGLRLQLANSETHLINLRFGIVYGPRAANWSAVEAILNTVASKSEISVGALATGRHFIHVDDVAGGIIASLKLGGPHTLNIQGTQLITLGDIINTASVLLGRTPEITETDPGNPSIRRVSGALMAKQTGWTANIGLEAGLGSVVDYLRSNGTFPVEVA